MNNQRSPWYWLYVLLRWGLSLAFMVAEALKLWDWHGFEVVLARYELLPEALPLPAAIGLPAMEEATGLGLIWEMRASLSVINGLLLLFTGALWFEVLRGLEIDYGCFFPGELAQHEGLRLAIYHDLGLIAVAAYLYLWRWWQGRPLPSRGWRWLWKPLLSEEING